MIFGSQPVRSMSHIAWQAAVKTSTRFESRRICWIVSIAAMPSGVSRKVFESACHAISSARIRLPGPSGSSSGDVDPVLEDEPSGDAELRRRAVDHDRRRPLRVLAGEDDRDHPAHRRAVDVRLAGRRARRAGRRRRRPTPPCRSAGRAGRTARSRACRSRSTRKCSASAGVAGAKLKCPKPAPWIWITGSPSPVTSYQSSTPLTCALPLMLPSRSVCVSIRISARS